MSDTNARIPIILCAGANGRAVVFGWVDTEPVPGDAVTLHNARMVLRWSAECGGLFGLAANGPRTTTRMTPPVISTTATVWQEVVAVSPAAAERLISWK